MLPVLIFAIPCFAFCILACVTYLNDDDKRAMRYLQRGEVYPNPRIDPLEEQQTTLQFQLFVYAAHLLSFGFIALQIPLALLIFIGGLWLPLLIAHTALFRNFFVRWSAAHDQPPTKQKRQPTPEMLQRLSASKAELSVNARYTAAAATKDKRR